MRPLENLLRTVVPGALLFLERQVTDGFDIGALLTFPLMAYVTNCK